ncbi:MAG: hypothetical protein AAFQ07_09960 [Chloroflexota bacterium]
MEGNFVQITGIVLCYGPLALVVLGFIGFAYLTDADVGRRYLRRLDDRTEEEMPDGPLSVLVTEPTEAKTPSGSRVIITPPGTEV